MDLDSFIRPMDALSNFKQAIVQAAVTKLERKLTVRERAFIFADAGFIALEQMHDYAGDKP